MGDQERVSDDAVKEGTVMCRKCRLIFAPSFGFDFYPDDKAGPGTGLCERCMMSEVFNADPVDLPEPGWEDKVCCRGKGAETCIFLVVVPGSPGSMFKCGLGSGMNNMLVERAQAGSMKARSIRCEGKHGQFALKEPPIKLGPDEPTN